ncbi:MAG TPA: zf-HC2 domain-containing protein [Terriglobales bacterium]|nr:zf-HC2 domain-containing protein [Terriglobales bacterium]
MNCTRFLQELADYLDGTLDTETRAELEEHLVWCHNCYVVCDTTKKTIQIYRDRQPYDLPEPLRLKLQAAIISKCKSSTKKS